MLIECSNLRDLSSRLDDVLGFLARPSETRPPPNIDSETSDGTSLQTPISTDTDLADTEDVIIDVQNHGHHETRRTSIYRGTWADRLGLDWWLLGHLLRRYRTMQHHFPFVVIPEAWDVQHMLISRPVLLLAVVSSSAYHYTQVQRALIKDLKDTLTCRVMVGGENSLELLQAFLVHLAWCVDIIDHESQRLSGTNTMTGHNTTWNHGVNSSTDICKWLSVWQWTYTWIQTLAS